jgi:hypothetical protein
MDVWCVCAFFFVCVVLCLGRGLATSWSPVQGVLPSVNDKKLRNQPYAPKVGAKKKKKNCAFWCKRHSSSKYYLNIRFLSLTNISYQVQRINYFANQQNPQFTFWMQCKVCENLKGWYIATAVL